MKIPKSDFFWVLARILAGLLLAYAGWTKLTEPAANFEATLLKYGIFNPGWIPWLARVVPWMEWLLGSFLIVGYAPRAAAGGASLLFLGFLATLTSSRLFLESGGSDCGCFGERGIHLSLRQIFLIDLAGLAATLRLAFCSRFPFSLHSFLVKPEAGGADIKETRRTK